MATTTNYGWTTPDDTALVKDGASAIRTLGSSVDTTTKNLNPETTLGDISYRSSTANVNTRLPLGTAGQVLKVNSGATAPEWATDATGMTNPMTTTGDTIYSSSGSTPARLAIGSTGNVLTVSGGVPVWAAPAAGGMTLISSSSIVGGLVLSSIPQTYKDLYIVLRGVETTSNQYSPIVRVNNDSTASRHRWIYDATSQEDITFNQSYWQLSNFGPSNGGTYKSFGTLLIPDYTNTTTWKTGICYYSAVSGVSTARLNFSQMNGIYNQTGAVSSLGFEDQSGSFSNGTVLLYGVK